MEETTYRVVKRIETVETEERHIYRVVLTPDDDSDEIIVTVEVLDGGDGLFRPVMPLSAIWHSTYQPLVLSRNQTETVMHRIVSHVADMDDSLLDNSPAW